MRVEFVPSTNYNQTLVISVFLHLLFMTVVLFLPAPVISEKVITPAFMVNLVELPSGEKSPSPEVSERSQPSHAAVESTRTEKPASPLKSETAENSARNMTAPPVEKPVEKPVKKPVEKPVKKPVEKPVEKPVAEAKQKPVPEQSAAAQKILRELEQLKEKLPPPRSLVEELDQVARLEPKASLKKQKKSILEKTFRNQDEASPKKFSLDKNAVAPPVKENLDEVLSKVPLEGEDENVAAGKPNRKLKELEFAGLTPQHKELEKKAAEKSAAELLKELQKIEELKAVVPQKSPIKTPESPTLLPENLKGDEAFAPIREKLGSLKPAPLKMDKGPSREKQTTEEFQSGLRKLKVPVKVPGEGVGQATSVDVVTDGQIGADLLSLYIGEIYKKIYEKWRQPVGAKTEGAEVFAVFYIFPKGNIDRPVIQKSSKDEKLDSLAIRAILDAEPFPHFPEEFKVSNLHVSIHFKYIPEKN